ncbi:MAG: MFS transporter [Candidatus Bathyarchaeaceae archaeon]
MESRVTVAASLAHFANDVPLTLLPAVLPILIEKFGLSYALAGAMITVPAFLMTSLQSVTGYIADRWNRITLLFVGLATLGIGTILIGFSTNYIQLLVFGCLMGIGGSFYHPIGYALLSDAFESGKRGKALGLGSAAGDIAVPVAFATSGFLVLVLGWRSIFMFWGLVSIFIAIIMPLIIAEPRKQGSHSPVTTNSTKEIVRTLIPVIIVMSFAAACYRIVSSFTTTYLTRTFKLSIELANAVTALTMAVGAVGAIIGGTLTDKLGEKITVSTEMVTLGVLSIVAVHVNNGYFVSVIICLAGFSLLGVWPSFYSAIAGATSLGARAFIYGLLFAIAWSLGSFFPYVSGVCADVFGLQVIYILVGVLSLFAAFAAYVTFK